MTEAAREQGDQEADDVAGLGALVLDLEAPAACQRWVTRRVETLSFRDERTIERDVLFSIDLSGYVKAIESVADEHRVFPLPVMTLAQPVRNVFLIEADGLPMPHCNSDEERKLVSAGLETKIMTLVESATSLTHESVRSAVEEGLALSQHDPKGSLTRHLYASYNVPLPQSTDATFDEAFNETRLTEVQDVDARADALAEIAHWAESFLLLVYIDVDRLHRPFELRVRYEEAIPRRSPTIDVRRRTRLVHAITSVLAGTLSWGDNVDMAGAYRAASFHVIAPAPPGFRVVGAGLFLEDPNDLFERGRWIFDPDHVTSRAHVKFRPKPGAAEQPSYFSLSLYANRTGFVSEAFAASLIVAGVLVAFTLRMQRINFAVSRIDTTVAAAIVLLVPGILSAVSIYKDGGRVASRAYAHVRMALLIQFLALLTASTSFAFDLSPGRTRQLWYWAAIVGWCACARVVAGMGLHCWRLTEFARRLKMFRRELESVKRQVRVNESKAKGAVHA